MYDTSDYYAEYISVYDNFAYELGYNNYGVNLSSLTDHLMRHHFERWFYSVRGRFIHRSIIMYSWDNNINI